MFKILYFDEEEERWILYPLEMCRQGRLCEECKKDIKHLNVCEHLFYDTSDKEIIESAKKHLESQGYKVKIEGN